MERQIEQKPKLFRTAWPIFIELGLQMLVGSIDQIMVSNVSETGVGAIGNANQIIDLMLIMFTIVSLAATILVSQYRGANRPDKAGEVCTLAVSMNLVVSVALSVILVLASDTIFGWMNVPDELRKETTEYFNIITSFMFIHALLLTLSSIFKSADRMKDTLVASAVMNVLNILGNALLIPKMGVAGAAIASNIGKTAALLILIALFKRRVGLSVTLKHLRPFPKEQLKRVMKVGLPSGGESVSYTGSQLMLQRMTNGFSPAAITTRVYGNLFAKVSYLYGSAMSYAAQLLVGYLMGARRIEETKKQVKLTLVSSMIVSIVISTAVYLLHEPLLSLLTKDEEVLKLCSIVLLLDIPLELGRAVNMVMVRSLQACGDVFVPIGVGVASMWLVSVGFGFLFGVVLGWGVAGIWAAMALDECARAFVFLIRFHGGKWQNKPLIEVNAQE